MRHHSIATPWLMKEYSLEDLKKLLNRHDERLDDILNKIAEAIMFLIAAGCTYKVIQLIYASNVSHQVYTVALQSLNSLQHIYTTALQGFL